MKTKRLAAMSTRNLVRSGPLLGALLGLALTVPFAGALRADAPPTSLTLRDNGPDVEGRQSFQLEWNSLSNATYLVQSATSLEPAAPWTTLISVVPTAGTYVFDLVVTDQIGLSSEAKFFRLILPQVKIFSVEPAVFAASAPVEAYVIGQCFESNDVVRVDGVAVSSVIYLSHNMLQGPLPTLSVGRHLVELVRGGVVKSSFTVTCADAFSNPEMVMQGPPERPPAAPAGKLKYSAPSSGFLRSTDGIPANRTTGGGYLDLDADNDGIPDVVEGVRLLPAPQTHIRVDSWASVFEMTTGGGGVSPFSGEVQLGVADLVIPGRGLDFVWARRYRSRTGPTTAQGQRWDFSYNVSLTAQPDGSVELRPGNGRVDTFYANTTGGWSRPEYFVEIGDLDLDGYPDVVTFADGGKWVFNSLLGTTAPGKLSQIVSRTGNTMKLHYDGGGQLIEVVDDLDRTNTVAYNLSGQIASVMDFSGRTVRYEYDGNGNLVTVISPVVIGTPNGNDFPGGKTNRYTYTSGFPFALNRQNHLLLSCVDALGQTTAQFNYDLSLASSPSYLRCISVQNWTNPPTMFTYLPQTPTPANQFATMRCLVNDPVGNVTGSSFDARNRCVKLEEFTGRATPGVPVTETVNQPTGKLRSSDPDSYVTRWQWNNDSLCTLETSPGGQKLQRIYESDFDASTPPRKRADCRVVHEIAVSPVDVDGDGAADLTERTWRYTYDSRFGSSGDRYLLGLKSYDTMRQYLAGDTVIYNQGVYLATDASGTGNKVNQTAAEQCDNGVGNNGDNKVTPVFTVKPTEIVDKYEFVITASFVTSVTDPRGNVTTGEYDTNGNCTKATPWKHHNIQGLDAPTLEFTYNPHGQLTSLTNAPDGNGYRRVDTFSYYTNGTQIGLLEVMIADAMAGVLALSRTFEYDPRGNLTRFVNPRGHDTLYTYNALNQLVRYQTPTNLTARCTTDFTYDANNNLVESATELRDENDAFVRAIVPKHVFDVLGRCVATVAQVSAGQFVTNKFFYDANDNVVAVHSPLAVSGADPHAITQFEYDERGLSYRTIAAPGSPDQTTTQWDYDANGNVTRVSEGLEGTARITTLEYDGFAGFGSASLQKYRGGGTMYDVDVAVSCSSLQIAADGTLNQKADLTHGGNCGEHAYSLQFEHGDINRPIVLGSMWGMKNAMQGMTGSPRNYKITDPNGNVTTFNYDANDNLKVFRHFGQLNDGPGTNGNVRLAESRWKYDGLDRRIEARTAFFTPATQAPIGDGASITTFAYAPNGQCTNVTDDLGRTTTFAYSTPDRVYVVTVPAGKSLTACLLDKAGNIIQITQTDTSDLGGPPQVFSRTNVYDAWDRLVSTTNNVGNNENWSFGSDGTLLRSVDARGAITRHEYDLLGRKTKTFQDMNDNDLPEAVDVVTTQTWDDNSRLSSSTDDNTNTTLYAYDSLNRQVLVTSPDGTAHSFVWNTSNDLVREQDPNGTVITNSYDLLGRCLRRDITPGPGVAATTTFETFAYDGASRLVAATNDVSHNEFDYDSMSNCTGNHADGWNVARSEYDGVGNRISLTYPSGRIVTYAYDALNQVTNVSSAASASTSPTSLAQFAYAGPGREARITRANGTQTDIAWNGLVSPPNAPGDFGRWQRSGIGHTLIVGGAVIDERITAYDRNQNKTLRAQTAPFYIGGPMRTNTFAYDALNRMTGNLDSILNLIRFYELDGNGNRQTVFSNGFPQSYEMDATIPPADFQMDQYTMTPFAGQAFDENGNLITENSTVAQLQYQYDFANRLVQVNDLFTGATEPVASYSYNALGQRISKTTYPPSPLAPVTKTFALDYWVDADPRWPGVYAARSSRIIEEHVGGVLSEVFVHVTGLKEEIRENDSVFRSAPPLVKFNATGAATYFHADDLGNVLALTDDLANVIGRNEYDDFGQPSFLTSDGTPIATNASPVGNSFLFRGMEWDAETGLYYQTANFNEGNFDTGFNSPLYDGDCFSRSGGGQYFDPQTASAIRGKVKVVRIDSVPTTFTLNPWSGGRPAVAQRRVSVNGSGANSARVKGSNGGVVELAVDIDALIR